MKRLYWLELIAILLGFSLVINNLGILAMALILLVTGLLFLFIKEFTILRFFMFTLVGYVLMQRLAISGGLDISYEYFNSFLLLVSINIATFYELISAHSYLKGAIKPYLFSFCIFLIFSSLALLSRNNLLIIESYPLGIFSLLALINIIFIPYLSCLTLSFILHEYNY